MEIGQAIKGLRGPKTQQQLCKELGITQKHLSEIENGHKKPNWAMLQKIVSALGADLLVEKGSFKSKVQ